MDPYDDGVGSYGRYDDDDRCPICFVPPRAPHLDSCDYDGTWDGDESQEPGPTAGNWAG